ncbi:multidrug efflux SMR transporter [Sinirhodobacter populi]|uniref:Guanidinium exporter n=1 Tax=Paenirhodobacter populi TaxID=2306993 RepID=A0A443K1D4_9RHOB|nr:multidrug efflux SMR transporter [Sinirhodobacter populi]RWR26567.1 multidrug efflux SMR transporter [Sinirhodobacter populi]
MAWVLLFVAGLVEVGWVIGMKYSQGFTRPIPSILTVIGIFASVLLLERAARDLPVATAYAVWGGFGALGTAVMAMILLGEPLGLQRLAGIALIVGGIVTLKMA